MKKICRVLMCVVVVCMFISVFAGSVSAVDVTSETDAEANVGTRMINTPPIYMVDDAGNRYGRTDWPSFGEARNYYGHNWSYSPCEVYYCGGRFNYYYVFTDRTKMFFGVK